MSNDLNRWMGIGRLTQDPELKHTNTGTAYCRFSIANNKNYTVNGERRNEVSFFNCVAWAKTAEIINQYCSKGKQIAIDGRLQQRSWENQEGKKQYSVDVVVDMIQFLGSVGDGNSSQRSDYNQQSNQQQNQNKNYNQNQNKNYNQNQQQNYNQPGYPPQDGQSSGYNSGTAAGPHQPYDPNIGITGDALDDVPF